MEKMPNCPYCERNNDVVFFKHVNTGEKQCRCEVCRKEFCIEDNTPFAKTQDEQHTETLDFDILKEEIRALENELESRSVAPNIIPGYEPLFFVLVEALDQAQNGKGKSRHATNQPFLNQPIMQIQDLVGDGFAIGQAIKKLQESTRMNESAAIAERLGAINYIAASILNLR